MKRMGALIESNFLGMKPRPDRRPAATRGVGGAGSNEVPWLFALIPVGSLVAAGLLVVLLSRFVATAPVPPPIDPPLVEAVGDDEWVMPFDSTCSR